jgi:hypothetical protein
MEKPRCGAKTRRGTTCKAGAIWSTRSHRFTRCRNHGGLSTGPRTPEGLERCRRAHWKHGWYAKSKAAGSTAECLEQELASIRRAAIESKRRESATPKQ